MSEEAQRAAGNFEEIAQLFRAASPMSFSHWNTASGETFSVRHSRRQRALVEAFEERLFEEEDWYEVPFQESDDAFAMIREWVNELRPGKGRAALMLALEGDKPFRAFRVVLKRFPGLARRFERLALEEAQARLVVFCLGQNMVFSSPIFQRLAAQLREQMVDDQGVAPVVATASLSIGRRR